MTQDQINGYIRTGCTAVGVLAGAGGLLSAFGISITPGQLDTLQTGLLSVTGLGFLFYSLYGSWRAHSAQGIITSAAAVPGTQIVTQPEIAQSTPANVLSSASSKVVPVTVPASGPLVMPGGH